MAFKRYNNLMECLMWFEVSPWQLVQDIFTKFYCQLENKKSSTVLNDKEEELVEGCRLSTRSRQKDSCSNDFLVVALYLLDGKTSLPAWAGRSFYYLSYRLWLKLHPLQAGRAATPSTHALCSARVVPFFLDQRAFSLGWRWAGRVGIRRAPGVSQTPHPSPSPLSPSQRVPCLLAEKSCTL